MSKLVYFTASTTFSGMVYGSYRWHKRGYDRIDNQVIQYGFQGLFWPLSVPYYTAVVLGKYIENNYSDIIEEKIREKF